MLAVTIIPSIVKIPTSSILFNLLFHCGLFQFLTLFYIFRYHLNEICSHKEYYYSLNDPHDFFWDPLYLHKRPALLQHAEKKCRKYDSDRMIISYQRYGNSIQSIACKAEEVFTLYWTPVVIMPPASRQTSLKLSLKGLCFS